MIKFEHTEVLGWEHAIRGMRNPKNSWERSDSLFNIGQHGCYDPITMNKIRTGNNINEEEVVACADWINNIGIGSNDHDLMARLAKGGPVHAKYRRMITVYVDITAPLYWWKEFDTYKVGTVANSCSTMHKIAAKEFTLEDFSCEHLFNASDVDIYSMNVLQMTIDALNAARKKYLETKVKDYWWQMIQLLPSSYNQKRTVMLNYEVLSNIYKSRQNHKLDEWSEGFIQWIESLPYSEIITGKRADGTGMRGKRAEILIVNDLCDIDIPKAEDLKKELGIVSPSEHLHIWALGKEINATPEAEESGLGKTEEE